MGAEATKTGEPAKLGRQDKKFIKTVIEDNGRELANAKLGVEKAQTQDVKEYAQKMVDDHTKTGEEITAISSQVGMELDKKEKEKEMNISADKQLKSASAKDFDKKFMEAMIKDHKKMVTLFEKQASEGENPRVRDFARKTVTALRDHQQMASRVLEDVKSGRGEPVTTGEQNPGMGTDMQKTKPMDPGTGMTDDSKKDIQE